MKTQGGLLIAFLRAMKQALAVTLSALFALSGCAGTDEAGDGADDDFATGKNDGSIDEGSDEALAVLALVNDSSVGFAELDDDARLNARTAANIIDHRNGPDDRAQTADDNYFDELAELDAVPYVGPKALEALLAYAIETGRLNPEEGDATVIFSPQDPSKSHAAAITKMIDQAQESIDIAMYSYSSANIGGALTRAAERGIKIRFVFETARTKDKKLVGSQLESSRSGRLELAGINVRYVNKIMHHKFIIIDGPRDDIANAETARLASGSANWSTGGASIYDENTLFLSGVPEMALKLQREFNLMWNNSRDIIVDANLPYTLSSLEITEAIIPDNPDLDLYVTSDNFKVFDTTFRLRSRESLNVSDKWVAAIENATDSIWLASGHMRLRPVAEALIAKKNANPDFDIRVYVDQQEYISDYGDNLQQVRREDCLAAASTSKAIFDCENKSFLWAKAIGEAGIDVHYKFYAYRWHFSYAKQMHNKFMLIDGDELLTGSYNLSINAAHSTFENVMHLKAPSFTPVVDRYVEYFDGIFDTGRGDGELEELREQIETDAVIPLIFDSLSVTHQEASDLKQLIRDNCSQLDTATTTCNR